MSRVLTWACRILGPALALLWATVYVWAQVTFVPLTDHERDLPSSGDLVLTLRQSSDATCEVWPASGANRTVALTHRSGFWTWGAVFGPRLERWYDGPATIHCSPSDTVYLSAGGPVALYPVGRTWLVPAAALLLTVAGFRRYFFPWLTRRRPVAAEA
ncbi:hypothetical protein AB0M46_40925 [Dactylosporangium sp. NPDC051485]|uniref:hypothetical protein n=1 Tax=Dactylosporangium sp. NPDC051485 TaxID=3154846 RepID=UPI003430E0DA